MPCCATLESVRVRANLQLLGTLLRERPQRRQEARQALSRQLMESVPRYEEFAVTLLT